MRRVFPLLIFVAVAGLHAADATPALTAGLDVTLEAAAGLSGGADTGRSAEALTIAHVAWQRPARAEGALELHTFASVLNHVGRGPTACYLGDFLAASNIEAYNSTRLYSWWAELGRPGWSLRAGALLADEEFTGTTAGSQLINSVFGWPAFISANTVNTGPAFFVAAPGIRLERSLVAGLTARVGVYDGDTFDSPGGDPSVNRDGLHYHLGGNQGWFTIAELAWAPEASSTRAKLGAWHHTATFADQYLDAAGRPFAVSGAAPLEHNGNFGVYAVVEHTLRGEAGQPGHLDTFARLGGAPSDRNALAWALDTGFALTGPIPGRPADVLAVGFAHAEFSNRFCSTVVLLDPTAARPDAEQVLELSYTLALTDHVNCKPDLQFIRHPGGSSAQSDATLVTLRLVADF